MYTRGMAKRGNGEGTIGKRKDGRWYASITVGMVGGKQIRKTLYGKTRREVAEKLTLLQRAKQQGVPLPSERYTVAQFLERWLADVVRPGTRPKTYASYSQIVRLYLAPALGKIQLSKLAPPDIQRLQNQLLEQGLSPRTVAYTRGILKRALGQAHKWGMVTQNVAALVDPPKIEGYEPVILTPAQAQTLLDAATGDRLEALYRVALSLGLREAEVLGLRWQDLDLDKGTLRVQKTLQRIDGKWELVEPKTTKSRRTLPLPAALITLLRAHRTRQLEERLQLGLSWQPWELVFCTRLGTPISPRNLVRDFKKLLRRADLPDIRFHDLRHSCASLLAAQGVPQRVTMEILGHTDIRLTQNVYTHVYDEAKAAAVAALEQLFEETNAGSCQGSSQATKKR